MTTVQYEINGRTLVAGFVDTQEKTVQVSMSEHSCLPPASNP
jgi:hypothetical protein